MTRSGYLGDQILLSTHSSEGPLQLEPVHRLHPYSARFPSELPERAILEFTATGDSVFDPFCGSGTSAVAALALGRKCIVSDIDTLAGMLTRLKCTPLPQSDYDEWKTEYAAQLKERIARLKSAWKDSFTTVGEFMLATDLHFEIPSFPQVRYWFPANVIAALATISQLARSSSDNHLQDTALVALSSCIISKWPSTLSYAMDVDHTRPHRRFQQISFDRVLDSYLRRLDRVTACLGQLNRLYLGAGVTDPHLRALVHCPHDARTPLEDLLDESQALVVTSPPYFTAVDYPRAHRLSLCWMTGRPSATLVSRRSYIGLRQAGAFAMNDWLRNHKKVRSLLPPPLRDNEGSLKKLCAFFSDLEQVLTQVLRSLRPGGHGVFVIASNVVHGCRVPTDEVLLALARSLSFSIVRSATREIHRDKRRFPVGPFGFDGPMTHEHQLVFRRRRQPPRQRNDKQQV